MKFLFCIFVGCGLACMLALGETIDRVVATVNGRPILQSDVDEAARYSALVEDKPAGQISTADLDATVDRLVDQELLRQQMGEMPPELSDDTFQSKLQEIRSDHARTDEQWRQVLASYGLNEQIFRARLEAQLRTMAFLDRRLRPSIVIDRIAVETYYRETFLPELRKSGAKQEPPLTEVQQRIREVLTQHRIDEMLTSWLHNLRQQSRVRILKADAQSAVTAATEK